MAPNALRHGCNDYWYWNELDKSHEVKLFGQHMKSALFHPNWSNGTAGVRGNRILNNGKFYWEIKISQRIFGTSMMFGIGTRKARLHANTFLNLLGEDNEGWGLSHKGLLWHGGKWNNYTKPFKENEATVVGLLFDGIAGTLTYYKDGKCLGTAFQGLNQIRDPLYPIICSTAAKTEMMLSEMKRDFVNLQDRCRAEIIKQIRHRQDIDNLNLPFSIRNYICEAILETITIKPFLPINKKVTNAV